MAQHTHATALQLVTILAFLVVVRTTVTTFAALKPESPFRQALAYCVG